MKNNSKHIVVLTPGFSENEEDSTTIPALQIFVKALKELNPHFDIKIITFQYPFTTETYDWYGIKVFPLNGQNKKLKKITVWNKAKKLLNRIHKEKPFDVIHSFWIGECAYIGDRFSIKHKIKHITTAMGQDVYNNYYNRFLISKRNVLVSLSKNQKDLLLKNTGRKSIIIPWGINPENFPKPQEKTIDILGVGSLNKIKNYSLFIQIIAKLKSNFNDLKVEIIGEGNLKHQLLHEIKEKKLEDIIQIKGELPRLEVLEKMAKSKVLLHTSSYESFGMVFLEALQSNMNIVSFEVGFSENAKNWKVCTTKNEMITALKQILKTNIETNYSNPYLINETVAKYIAIYNE